MFEREIVMQETNIRHVAIHFHLGRKKGVSKGHGESALNEQSLR